MPYPTLVASAAHSFARLMTAVGAWGAWAIRTRRLAGCRVTFGRGRAESLSWAGAVAVRVT